MHIHMNIDSMTIIKRYEYLWLFAANKETKEIYMCFSLRMHISANLCFRSSLQTVAFEITATY